MRIGSITLPARRGRLMRSDAVQRLLAFAALIVIIIIFSLLTPNFLQFDNAIGILLATTVNGILALGVTFVIISGGIDLSIGTVKALALVVSGLKPIYFNDTPEFNHAAMGSVLGTVIPGFDIPNLVLVLFGMAIVASLILSRTILGRFTFALGSNEEAARLSGVNVDVWKMAVFTVAGIFSGIAGVLIGARLNSAQPSLGQGYELDAIAAAVIGGTSLSGGEGSILGTVIGAFIISTLTNGLRIMSVPQEWQTVVTGGIVIVAVYLDIVRRRRQA